MAIADTFHKILFLIISASLFACNTDEEINVCGPFDPPEAKIEEELFKSTFQDNKNLELLSSREYRM